MQAFTAKGSPRMIDFTNVSNLTADDVALISCDPNGGNIDPSTTVVNAGNQKPQAIVLYSLNAQQCNLTGPYSFTSMFTLLSQKNSEMLTEALGFGSASGTVFNVDAAIGPNVTSAANQSTSTSSTANDGGPAPTTAVAMSILYSITGIITLLFLIIIATGAIRAHRHPERYGPRNGFPGRPRQSRAKGLARAMLETLPIVKFGDPEPVKPGIRDIELEDGNASVHAPTTLDNATEGSKAEVQSTSLEPGPATTGEVKSGMGPAQAESVKSAEEDKPKEGELGCSICTEDFNTGEDVRVLPCHHKYHPACIDPWLLNVSGTCPLW